MTLGPLQGVASVPPDMLSLTSSSPFPQDLFIPPPEQTLIFFLIAQTLSSPAAAKVLAAIDEFLQWGLRRGTTGSPKGSFLPGSSLEPC